MGVRTPAMEPNATDSPVDESPGVDATGHEATGRKRPDFVLDRGGARDRLPDTGTEDPSLAGQPERRGPEGLERAWKEGTPKPLPLHRPQGRCPLPQGRRKEEELEPEQVPAPHPQESRRTNPRGNPKVRGTRRPGAHASGPRPDRPARKGRKDRAGKGECPSLCRPRIARPFDAWSPKASDERSGVATPGAPASAGTNEVRRAGGLRGPHANASGPAPDGEASRQLLANRKDAEARPARPRPARRTGKPDLWSDRRTRCATGDPIMHPESTWKDLASNPDRRETLVEETRERRTAGGKRPQ